MERKPSYYIYNSNVNRRSLTLGGRIHDRRYLRLLAGQSGDESRKTSTRCRAIEGV